MNGSSVPQIDEFHKCVGCGFRIAREEGALCHTCRLIAEADLAEATPEQITKNCEMLGGVKGCNICAGKGVDYTWDNPIPCPNCHFAEWQSFNALRNRRPTRKIDPRATEQAILDTLGRDAYELAKELAARRGVSIDEAVTTALIEAAKREGLA
jgi:hypothetical protein